MKFNYRKELFFPLIFIILGIIVFLESNNFPKTAAFFPRLLAVTIILLSLFLILKTLKKVPFEKSISSSKKEQITTKEENIKIVFILLIGLIVYTFIIKYFGYLISTVFLIYYTIFFLKYEKKKNIVGISVIIGVMLFLIFKYLFKTPLPQGSIFNLF